MGKLFGKKPKGPQGPQGAHAWTANEQARKEAAERKKKTAAGRREKLDIETRRY